MMNIRLLETKVHRVQFELVQKAANETGDDRNFSLEYKAVYDDNKPKVFAIIFMLKLGHENEFSLEMEYAAWFGTSKFIDKDFKKSAWTAINAPAIAFPYLRAYVSNFTLQNGMEPEILPTINFVQMVQQSKKAMSVPAATASSK